MRLVGLLGLLGLLGLVLVGLLVLRVRLAPLLLRVLLVLRMRVRVRALLGVLVVAPGAVPVRLLVTVVALLAPVLVVAGPPLPRLVRQLRLRARALDRRQQRFDTGGGEARFYAVSASGTPYFASRSGIIDSTGALRRQFRPNRAWSRAW